MAAALAIQDSPAGAQRGMENTSSGWISFCLRMRAFVAIVLVSAVCFLAPAAGAAPESATVPVTALAFSPDGAALVSNGSRRVDIRSPQDGAGQSHIPCDLLKITSLMFHPRGEILGVAGGEPGVSGEARLIDWRTKTVRQRFINAQDLATGVAFNAALHLCVGQ